MRRIVLGMAALFTLAGTADAQPNASNAEITVATYFTTYRCPPDTSGAPGSSRENPIAIEQFEELFERSDGPSPQEDGPVAHDCKWVRISGVMNWMNYYHYRATLWPSAMAAHGGGRTRYIVESFADPSVRRANLVRRQVTLVGQFYDLCAAAERARAGRDWGMTFGPCHYGSDNGMMLRDVSVVSVEASGPHYILGERNRAAFGDLIRVQGAERQAMIDQTRAWAALVQRGPTAYADAHLAHMSTNRFFANLGPDEPRRLREFDENPDGYISYAGAVLRARRPNLSRAQIEVFWDKEVGGSNAVGCVCLANSCVENWPLTSDDADAFVGDAVCTELDKTSRAGAWSWW